jgi:6,7-dimethyl-8-ribityllumazine synthase
MDGRVKTVEGDFNARGMRFGIVASRFNDFIVDRLIAGALDMLTKHGASPSDIEIVRVPGAFEMPLALKKLAAGRRYNALLALGCVIRGATPHFDYVAGEATRGIGAVSLEHEIPIGFGLLTVETIEQATDRAGNITESRMTVVVDTTPPAMEVEIVLLPEDKVLVKGNVKDAATVTIDAKPVDVDMFGRFERQIATDPDTIVVEIVAKDALGNTVTIKRPTRVASPMSAK